MTDAEQGAALLRGVKDAPDDDLPRLVYADWLDENGRAERAEFVRLQIGKERDPDFHGFLCLPERQCKNCRRETELVSCMADVPPLPGRNWLCDAGAPEAFYRGEGGSPLIFLRFYRGFVGSVRCTLGDWLEHGPAIVAAHPVMRVELTDKAPTRVGEAWMWTCDVDGLSDDLPDDLFALIDRRPTEGLGFRSVFFPAEKDALDALSVALLALARG